MNRAAAARGCLVGETVRHCAERLCEAPVIDEPMPPIQGGRRYAIGDRPGEPPVVCLDAAPMLETRMPAAS